MTVEASTQAIARRLVLIRAILDIDQREAARIAGVTLRSWRRWEAGHPFNTPSMLKIGYVFDLSLDWLIGGMTAGLRRRFTSGATDSRIVVMPVGRARSARW